MRKENYPNQKDDNLRFYDLYERDFKERLEFARDNGCNTVMLTGNSEPQQNIAFLKMFGTLNRYLDKPFRWIEMQTTGVLIGDEYLRFFRNHVGVSTISVSMSSFDNLKNQSINGTPEKLMVDIKHLCSEIKRYDFCVRVSINLTEEFDKFRPDEFFAYCKEQLRADQVTLRVLYADHDGSAQSEWVKKHAAKSDTVQALQEYIEKYGRALERLEYGRMKMSVCSMSTVLDDDCMSTAAKDELKYVILRPNCKLYSKWDDEASLIF